MSLKIWLNDGLVEQDRAVVSVFDHGLLYGDGVFEGIRVYGGNVFELNAHLKRLYDSAKAIRLEIPVDMETLGDITCRTCEANNVYDGYIRLVVTRGPGDLGINPFLCKKPNLFVIASNIQMYPEEIYQNGLKVVSSSVLRNHPLALSPQVKSLNYLNNVLAKIEAIDSGVLEAIMFNHLGYVAEASGDNVFIVKNGVVYTPPIQSGSLDGITRKVVIELARASGIEVVEQDLTRVDLYTCDELFLTGTAAEVVGVIEIDKRTIGSGKPGEVTNALREKFFEYVRK